MWKKKQAEAVQQSQESQEPSPEPAKPDVVGAAVTRMALNLEAIMSLTHSPDIVRQLREDFAVLREAMGR
jgi:hypothetical protein